MESLTALRKTVCLIKNIFGSAEARKSNKNSIKRMMS